MSRNNSRAMQTGMFAAILGTLATLALANGLIYDLLKDEKTFTPIVAEISDDSFQVIDNVGDKFLVATDRKAPNGRVWLYDPASKDAAAWKDVLHEKETTPRYIGVLCSACV